MASCPPNCMPLELLKWAFLWVLKAACSVIPVCHLLLSVRISLCYIRNLGLGTSVKSVKSPFCYFNVCEILEQGGLRPGKPG